MNEMINKKLIVFDKKKLNNDETIKLRKNVDMIRDELKKIVEFKRESISGNNFCEFTKNENEMEIGVYNEIINKDRFWSILKNQLDDDSFDEAEQLWYLTSLYCKLDDFRDSKESQLKDVKREWDDPKEQKLIIESFEKEIEMFKGLKPIFDKAYDVFKIDAKLKEQIIADETELQRTRDNERQQNKEYLQEMNKYK